jgi:hypothetical protein
MKNENYFIAMIYLVVVLILVLGFFTFIAVAGLPKTADWNNQGGAGQSAISQPQSGGYPCGLDSVVCEGETENDVEKEIIRLCTKYDFPIKTALKIAECESGMGKYLVNSQSSAKGIYQFIDETWERNCKGDVMNATDNIMCFIKMYPKHKDWWECSG